MDTVVLGDSGVSLTLRTIEKEGRICQGGGGGKNCGQCQESKEQTRVSCTEGKRIEISHR